MSEADQAAVRKEFSQESYEEAMKKAGRGAELEEEKRRAAEHMQGR
ncbi:MAG TPA: hypothetical protein VM328_07550 [Fimbriimonadaceae bacterium]|nr:hypothetical protein [Fimbriimonadaceae bacterium]